MVGREESSPDERNILFIRKQAPSAGGECILMGASEAMNTVVITLPCVNFHTLCDRHRSYMVSFQRRFGWNFLALFCIHGLWGGTFIQHEAINE